GGNRTGSPFSAGWTVRYGGGSRRSGPDRRVSSPAPRPPRDPDLPCGWPEPRRFVRLQTRVGAATWPVSGRGRHVGTVRRTIRTAAKEPLPVSTARGKRAVDVGPVSEHL